MRRTSPIPFRPTMTAVMIGDIPFDRDCSGVRRDIASIIAIMTCVTVSGPAMPDIDESG